MKKKLKDWEQFETDVAEYLGGYRQPGSGNSPMAGKKGDIKSEEYLTECKCTGSGCYTLSRATFAKIVSEALNAFRVPLFAARTTNGDYMVGMRLDFPDMASESDVVSVSPKNIKLDGSFDRMLVKSLDVNGTAMDIVCWKVDLGEDSYE